MAITFENVQADTPKTVDVRVVDLGQKSNLRRCHGVVFRQEQFEMEDTTYLTKSYNPLQWQNMLRE